MSSKVLPKSHIIAVLESLHLLPVCFRIDFNGLLVSLVDLHIFQNCREAHLHLALTIYVSVWVGVGECIYKSKRWVVLWGFVGVCVIIEFLGYVGGWVGKKVLKYFMLHVLYERFSINIYLINKR